MKKTILLVFTISVTINIFSQNTYVPDDNFESKLIELGYDSGPLDDYVLTSAVNQITTLSLSQSQIQNMTGIEDFTSLKELDCSLNGGLINLNLSSLLQLEKFTCNDNWMDSFDFSNNTKLTHVSIKLNNFDQIDFSNNVDLVSINCEWNQLTNLNVSNCVNLEYLNCSKNHITNLSLQLNTKLKFLYCEVNSLNTLSTSYNPELIILDCNRNELVNINIENSPKLKYLNCINNELQSINTNAATLLEQLYISWNHITHIDVTQNSELIKLDIQDNDIEILNLSNNSHLNYLQAMHNNLKFVDLRNENNQYLSTSSLDLNNNDSLHCVLVDDALYSNLNWVNSAPQITFSEECYYLGTNEKNDIKLSIYPNPVIDIVTITTTKETKFTLLNMNGQIIQSRAMPSGDNCIDLSALAKGLYIITVHNNNNTITKHLSKL